MGSCMSSATPPSTRRDRLGENQPAPGRPKAAEAIVARIRRQIAIGDLSEGDSLRPESDLLAEYPVSRPTLREAFRVLEAEGLITIVRGAKGGARVHGPDPEVVSRYVSLVLQTQNTGHRDVLEALKIILPPACRLAAERATEEEFAGLRGQYDVMAKHVGEQTRFNEEATTFMDRLLTSIQNHTLALSCKVALDIYNQSIGNFPTSQANRDWILPQFSELLHLLEQRKGRAAEGLWVEYVSAILDLADQSKELRNGRVTIADA